MTRWPKGGEWAENYWLLLRPLQQGALTMMQRVPQKNEPSVGGGLSVTVWWPRATSIATSEMPKRKKILSLLTIYTNHLQPIYWYPIGNSIRIISMVCRWSCGNTLSSLYSFDYFISHNMRSSSSLFFGLRITIICALLGCTLHQVHSYVVGGTSPEFLMNSRLADIQCKLIMSVGRTPDTKMRKCSRFFTHIFWK